MLIKNLRTCACYFVRVLELSQSFAEYSDHCNIGIYNNYYCVTPNVVTEWFVCVINSCFVSSLFTFAEEGIVVVFCSSQTLREYTDL